ncbi:MAG: biliverdin-producing heme oxygenase [Kiloniellaceae bacterium]
MNEMAPDLRSVLRAATAPDHARLDRAVSTLDLSVPQDYRDFLQLHAAVLLPLERWLVDNAVADDLPDWPERSRGAALLDDLGNLQMQPATACSLSFDLRPFSFDNSLAVKAGMLYVLEGSRLGGRLLLRQVQAGPAGFPTAFLEHGVETKLWPSFTVWLARLPREEGFVTAAVASAQAVFLLYEQEARQRLRELGQ